jgi:hypothetical protein
LPVRDAECAQPPVINTPLALILTPTNRWRNRLERF